MELYDHVKDPNEWTNLASSPDYSKVLKSLRKKLAEKHIE